MFNIDYQVRIPIYEQIVNQVERFIICGILKDNEQLPSVRQMAFDLGINPNTIQKAYTMLEQKKMIVTVVGKGSFVTDQTNSIIDRKTEDIVDNVKKDVETLKSLGLTTEDIKNKLFKD